MHKLVRLLTLSSCITNTQFRTAHETAWEYILRRPHCDSTTEQLQTMFPDPDLDHMGLSPIHQAVLQLRPGSLDTLLKMQTQNTLDKPDSRGRTPLFWAASRGDYETTSMLIRYGANVHKTANPGDTPLWTAIRSGSRPCVKLLLDNGADPNNFGSTNLPIDALGRYSDDTEMLKVLMDAKIDINQIGIDGTSALTIATQSGNTKVATELINLGADIHHCEEDGTNSLYMATYSNNHVLVKLLLSKGADHVEETHIPLGPYLHMVAEAADLRTLELLTDILTPRDIYRRRADGKTAMEIARNRSGVDGEWHNAFNVLIRNVYRPEFCDSSELKGHFKGYRSFGEEDEADAFVDALETQP